jgi:hypothetical protein
MSQASFHIIGDLLEREVYNLGPALSAVNITMFEGTGLKEWLHKEIHLPTGAVVDGCGHTHVCFGV